MKILIIDDSPEALAIAKARLAAEGAEIVVAGNGVDGLLLAAQESPDLVLLDLDMPDLDGFDVCRRLKSDSLTCMIPIIFLTGSGDRSTVVQALDLGAVDYVRKPFEPHELQARVRAALRTKHLQDLLMQYAQIDPLTELGNRRALMQRLTQEWAHIRRNGGTLAFIMGDVDRFKGINDRHGHLVGDRVLQTVANVFKQTCRAGDFPARFGGEEFAILLADLDREQAASLAERCRTTIEQSRVPVHEETISPTVSFGVSDSTSATSIEELVDQADQALYAAKASGRNRVCCADKHTAKSAKNSEAHAA